MRRRPAEPAVSPPSEEIKIILGLSREGIHYQSGEGDENSCGYKDFHRHDRVDENLLNLPLRMVIEDTIQAC